MKIKYFTAVLLVVTSYASADPKTAKDLLIDMSKETDIPASSMPAQIESALNAATVHIGTKYKNYNGWGLATGSGFFVKRDGHLVLHTAKHVLDFPQYFLSLDPEDKIRKELRLEPIVLTTNEGQSFEFSPEQIEIEIPEKRADHAIIHFHTDEEMLRRSFTPLQLASERPDLGEPIYVAGFPAKGKSLSGILPRAFAPASGIYSKTQYSLSVARTGACIPKSEIASAAEPYAYLEGILSPYFSALTQSVHDPVPLLKQYIIGYDAPFGLSHAKFLFSGSALCAYGKIQHGNSGGPAVDANGRVIGVVVGAAAQDQASLDSGKVSGRARFFLSEQLR